MADYIKSHSNFVLKKKHQDINSGVIYERDITTIGGLNQFAKGQTPIYKSSNFIITINNEIAPTRNIKSNNWYYSPSGDNIWTMTDVNMVENKPKESCELVIKQDYHSLKDFAYYGSCVELIRASISNIALKFPGSLYVPSLNEEGVKVYYETLTKTSDGKIIKDTKRLGDDQNLILVSNPSNINIHTEYIDLTKDLDPLKYMCNDGFKNYVDENGNEITWKLVNKYGCVCRGNGKCEYSLITKNDIEKNYPISDIPIGKKVADIELGGFKLYVYKGNGGEIVYLTDSKNKDKLIAKPKSEFFIKFYNSLDNFEKILMNPSSTPKYSALFEVISENSFGYETELKKFTFPTIDNGNNLAIGDNLYSEYVNSFLSYAELYDEIFSDNLWRSMTHESIKNFDWSFTREYSDGDEEDYILGGSKIQKAIRLIGREFDEIKTYADGIKNFNQITYGSDNLLPDYFLTDVLNDEGWDIVNIYPFEEVNLSQINKLETPITPYNYNKYPYGYFYDKDGGIVSSSTNDISYKIIETECGDYLAHKSKDYINDKEYTLDEINNEFLKRLILNSRNIWRKKGTIEGIETLLSLFGLKSKRMVKDSNDSNESYDYEIIEYISKVNAEDDRWIDKYSMCEYDWYNSTKTIVYDTDDYRNGIYHSYQGLPVRSYIEENGIYIPTNKLPINKDNELSLDNRPKYLLPYFSKNKIIDGNPYYQMNGGWLKKTHFILDENGKHVKKGNEFEKIIANTETYRDIRTVENLKELVGIPMQTLKTNDIFYVNDLSEKLALIDGIIYDIYTDENNKEYVRTYISNNTVKVGYKFFSDEISVSDENGNTKKYILSQYPNNTELRIYLKDNKLFAYGKYYSINQFVIFNNDSSKSNFFKLNDVQSKLKIGGNGWNQLSKDDKQYQWLNTIIDKYSGNNPHSGHLSYDNGYEYISYFKQIFKYAIENLEFNEKCYEDFLKELENIKNVGFKFGGSSDCDYDITNETNVDREMIGDGSDYLSGIEKITNNITKIYSNDNKQSYYINIEFNSDKIVNVKRMKMKVKVNKDYELKFFDSVVLNYLSQMIPSTLIVELEYISS